MFNIPTSISNTYYLLEEKYKCGWIFVVVFMFTPILMIMPWIDISSERYEMFPALSCMALAFVGAAPFFKDHSNGVHFVAAGICMMLSQAWIVLDTDLWWLSVACFAWAIVPTALNTSKALYWFEIAAFTSTFGAVLVQYLTILGL